MTVNDEKAAYRLMMEPGPPEVVAHVTVPGGHVVELVTRRDGTRGWIDRACLRATTPDFPAHAVPFIDEAVSAWHEGTLTLADYTDDYPTRLAAATAKVEAAQAKVSRVQMEGSTWALRKARASSQEARKERVTVIREAARRGGMSVGEIATAAMLSSAAVSLILTGQRGGPLDQT